MTKPVQESITCYKCGMTSFNVNDVKQQYCGHCHRFHDEMKLQDNLQSHKSEKEEKETK